MTFTNQSALFLRFSVYDIVTGLIPYVYFCFPGPYQPSNDMMLMFYSLFKQATIGPCNIPKPAFWDIINKAKWNAWSALGGMSKEDAMGRYVEEIKKV